MKQSVAKISKNETNVKINVKIHLTVKYIYTHMCACIYTHKKIPNALSFLNNLYLVSCKDYVLIYEWNYWPNIQYYTTKNYVK